MVNQQVSSPIRKLGVQLMDAGLINEYQLSRALTRQKHYGGRLGTILHSDGILGQQALLKQLAVLHKVAYVDLIKNPADPSLLQIAMLDDYIQHEYIPCCVQDGKLVVVCTHISDYLRAIHPVETCFSYATRRDIYANLHMHYGSHVVAKAITRLRNTQPQDSCVIPTTYKTRAWMLAIALSLVALGVFQAEWFLMVFFMLCLALYTTTLVLKLGLIATHKSQHTVNGAIDIKPELLPVYTILVPLYQEAESVPRILRALRGLKYPPDKLDIKCIIEEDDAETLQALQHARPACNVDIIRVPYSLPRTKPKACNVALQYARGEFITIFDAEDMPEPRQLTKVLSAFSKASPDVVCIQARLNYYNRGTNLLCRWFSIEYSLLFNWMLPAMATLGVPLLLGGTSNHFRTQQLHALGGWDPYNVTEDADLGLRLAARGLRTEILAAYTMEEAPIHLSGWICQRTRWIKGYWQSWLVSLRHRKKLRAYIGWWRWCMLQLFIGGASLVYFTSPLMWMLGGYIWWTQPIWITPWMCYMAAGVLLAGCGMQWVMALMVVMQRKYRDYSLAILLFPCYWMLHSIASFRAVWQFTSNRYYWDKTQHGLVDVPYYIGANYYGESHT